MPKTVTLTDEQWQEFDNFLQSVADEREQDSDGPGSCPSHNSNKSNDALILLSSDSLLI